MALTVDIQATLDKEMSRQLGEAWLENAKLRLALTEALVGWRKEIDEPPIVGAGRGSLIAHIESLRNARLSTIRPDPDGGTSYVEDPVIGVGFTDFPDGLQEFPPFMIGAGEPLDAQALRKRFGLPDPHIVRPTDPLDVEYDGVTLRELLQRDQDNTQGDRLTGAGGISAWRFTPDQRSAVSAHWSAELRARVAVSKAADEERDQRQVLVDLEDE